MVLVLVFISVSAPQPKEPVEVKKEVVVTPQATPQKEAPPPEPVASQDAEPSSKQPSEKDHEPRLGPRPRSHNRVLNPPGGKSSVVFYWPVLCFLFFPLSLNLTLFCLINTATLVFFNHLRSSWSVIFFVFFPPSIFLLVFPLALSNSFLKQPSSLLTDGLSNGCAQSIKWFINHTWRLIVLCECALWIWYCIEYKSDDGNVMRVCAQR